MASSTPRLGLFALLALLASGCVHSQVRLDATDELRTPVGEFHIESRPGDPGAATVRSALETVAPRLQRWGQLREQVVVRVMPDHASLEQAVGRSGYEWLRAWAFYRIVYVQSPCTWSESGASQAQVNELMLHELTHCLMYQQAAPHSKWRSKKIPVWFREGMASVTADQGYRRAALPDLRAWFAESQDPIDEADAFYRSRSQTVYSTAHHAFSFLVHRYGDDGVRRILAAMYDGNRFDEAFREAIGIDQQAFEREFRHYIVMQGWRHRPD